MKRHILIMVLCCSIPLALTFLLPYMSLTVSSEAFLFFVMLLCPLMHFLLMGRMGHRDESHYQDCEQPRKVA